MDKLMKQPAMVARVQASMDGLFAVETDTRTVLCGAGVRPTVFPLYFNFTRELWNLTNRVSGEAAAAGPAARYRVAGKTRDTSDICRYLPIDRDSLLHIITVR